MPQTNRINSQKTDLVSFTAICQSIVSGGYCWFLILSHKLSIFTTKIKEYVSVNFFNKAKSDNDAHRPRLRVKRDSATSLPNHVIQLTASNSTVQDPSSEGNVGKKEVLDIIVADTRSILTTSKSSKKEAAAETKIYSKENNQVENPLSAKEAKAFEYLKKKGIPNIRKIRDNKEFIPTDNEESQCTPVVVNLLKIARLDVEELKEAFPKRDRDELEKQVIEHGSLLAAHGIEVRKGGMRFVLNIMLEGLCRSKWWAQLISKNGDPSCRSGAHGPYFIIIDEIKLKSDEAAGKRFRVDMIDEIYHIAYLIPSPKRREFLFKALDKAVEINMLTQSEVDDLKSKIITYQEFMRIPKSIMTDTGAFKAYFNSKPIINNIRKIPVPRKDPIFM